MRKSFLLLCIFFCVILYSCESPIDVHEHEIYSLLDQVIKDENMASKVIWSSFDTNDMELSGIMEFSEYDYKFFRTQMKKLWKLKITNDELNDHIGTDRKMHKMIIRSNIDSCQIVFSFPFISNRRKKAIISFNHPDGYIQYLYLKKNGRWKREKILGAISQ
jgi:hypothetical protein